MNQNPDCISQTLYTSFPHAYKSPVSISNDGHTVFIIAPVSCCSELSSYIIHQSKNSYEIKLYEKYGKTCKGCVGQRLKKFTITFTEPLSLSQLTVRHYQDHSDHVALLYPVPPPKKQFKNQEKIQLNRQKGLQSKRASMNIKRKCANEQKQMNCDHCRGGQSNTVYLFGGEPGTDYTHTLPSQQTHKVFGFHNYSRCVSCYSNYRLRQKDGSDKPVSCQQFYHALKKANDSCHNCIISQRHR